MDTSFSATWGSPTLSSSLDVYIPETEKVWLSPEKLAYVFVFLLSVVYLTLALNSPVKNYSLIRANKKEF